MTVPSSESQPYPPDLIPRPDPTKLTDAAIERATDQFRRELDAVRELHDKDLKSLIAILDARLDGMDQDRARLWERMHELPGQQEITNNHFRDEVARRDAAGRELIEQRLTDLDKARGLAARQMEKFLEEARETHRRIRETFAAEMTSEREFILAQLQTVQAVTVEKFVAVDGQFSASKIAVDAALSAAKEAVTEQNKANSAAIKVSEANTKEQLTSLGQVSSANFKAQEDKIDDARTRLTSLESRTAGIKESKVDTTSSDRDAIMAKQAELQAEQTRLQAFAARMQLYALVITVIVVALGLYTAFHKPLQKGPSCRGGGTTARLGCSA